MKFFSHRAVFIVALYLLISIFPIPAVSEGDDGFIPEILEMVITIPNEFWPMHTRILNGNLTIESGGSLTLEQSHLYVNSTNSQEFGIHVKPGGTLILRNSTIESRTHLGYSFVIEGTLRTNNCTISGMYYPGDYEISGLQIYSSDTLLNDTVISNVGYHASGIHIHNASPEIRNCRIYSEYCPVFLLNDSFPLIFNATLSSDMYVGQGLVCYNASFRLESCTILNNYAGINIISGEKGEIVNTTFLENGFGLWLSPGSGLSLTIEGCTFEKNRLNALTILGNASIAGCAFENNGIPGMWEPVGAVYIFGFDREIAIRIQNCTFLENHNGIVSSGASLDLSGCSFENNTRYSGTSGAIIYGSVNNTGISVRECMFKDNPIGIEMISANTSISYEFRENVLEGNGIGLRSLGNILEIHDNEFRENECALEERYLQAANRMDNTYLDNTLDYRFMVQVRIEVKDGYGIPLGGAYVSFMPAESMGDYTPGFRTDEQGQVIRDVKWLEQAETTCSYFPYNITAGYRGIESYGEIRDLENTSLKIVVLFPRPELKVRDVEIKNQGFSLWEDIPRKDETSYICFTIKNKGEGKAGNATVIVMAGEKELKRDLTTFRQGEKKKYKVRWVPDNEGKINISVKVYDPDELNVIREGLDTELDVDVGENQGNYYYLIVIIVVLVISAMVWWMAKNIEGADKTMAKLTRNLKLRIANFLEAMASRLRKDEYPQVRYEATSIPAGTITSWTGHPTMSGTGRYKPWSIEDENIRKMRKKDIITIEIKIPPPEPDFVIDDTQGIEAFEWITTKGKKQQIKVDKRTLMRLSHPKIYICSLCDRRFVSIEADAKCPWCMGKAIFLQEM